MAGWQPTTCFNKILGLEKRIKAIYGGSSSGKTFNVLAKLYQDAVDTPGERITVASNTLANLKKGAVRDLRTSYYQETLGNQNAGRRVNLYMN